MEKERVKKKDSKALEDLDLVCGALEEATQYGLQGEVFLWTLYYMKVHPEATITEALDAGMWEWDL